jgi:macrolide transport system ATP-binding/permease protein
MTGPLIELREVERRYELGGEQIRALAGVSLSIQAGEFVAIMGQSGSGKSTLMNLLGCLDQPSSGQFLIDGQDASHLDADQLAQLRRERFGFIFQRYHLLPHLDACGNAALPAVYAGLTGSARRDRAESLLQRLGLGERMHHRPNELSGGQQQRVSIARALMNGGQIILADEPTGALDSHSGAELLALLAELNAAGHTIILVTHDREVAAHARRVIELRDGRVIADNGTPAGHRVSEAGDATPRRGGGRFARWQLQWREALATAWSSLKGNRLRSALSMLGISIGIASVVSIVALTSAARTVFEGEFRSLMSGVIWVWAGNNDGEVAGGPPPPPFQLAQIEALRTVPGIRDVQPERQMPALLRHKSRDGSVQLRGADAATLRDRKLRVDRGRFFSGAELAGAAQVIVLDEQAAKALFREGESPVGKLVLVSDAAAGAMPQADAQTAMGLGAQPAPPNTPMPFTVIGTVKTDSQLGFNFGSGNVYVPESSFLRRLDPRPSVGAFAIQLDFSQTPDEVLRQVKHRLRALRGSENFGTWSGEAEFQKMQNFNAGFAALFAGVGAIALIVGGVGVMNIMLVSVSERTREIGIRMAVGARQSDVRLQFLIEAVVLCCLGGLVGVAFSWLAAQGLNAAQDMLKVDISWAALAVAFAVSSAVGLIFGTVPARRAAALSPVDALARE